MAHSPILAVRWSGVQISPRQDNPKLESKETTIQSLFSATVHELRRMSVNPASPMKNINVKRVGTRGLGSISRKDNRSDISLAEIDEKKRHHRKVSALKNFQSKSTV